MGSLTQTVRELAGVVMIENGIPADEELRLISFGLDFIRMMQQDTKTFTTPDRDKTETFYFAHHGVNSVQLPVGMGDIISVGVQVGRYIKGLALNTRMTSQLPVQPTKGLVTTDGNNNQWYWGGYYGVGMWGGSGSMGLSSYGNGQDFGDYFIDYATQRIHTSQFYPYTNLVLHYYTTCVAPSGDTCVHPWFISCFKDYLMWKWYRSRQNLTMAETYKQDFAGAYQYQITQQNKISRTTIIKIIERNLGYRNGRV